MKCPKCQFENPETQRFCGECGTKLDLARGISVSKTLTLETPAEELGRGTIFAGRYEIIEELGSGGMGKIYRAYDKKIEGEVALKLIRPEIAVEKKTVDRFRNELKIAREIAHRNVCRMYDLNEEKGTYYITMEYVRGEDLKSVIHRMKQLTAGTAVSVAKQVSEGLSEAHRLGVVHRDLKSSNIMIDKEGNAKIMDFGIARWRHGAGITAEGAIIGTPEYMSPEQVEGKEADSRADIYALGVILYEMLTGHIPFEGDTPLAVAHKQKYEEPQAPRKLNPQIPEDLNRLILKCLEKERAKRYQTAEELISELTRIQSFIPGTERIIPRREPLSAREITAKFRLKKLFVPALIFFALVIAAAILWRFLPRKETAPAPVIENSIAVISFENLTGDKAYDYLQKAIPSLLITGLEQTGFFQVATWERMNDLLKQMGKGEVDIIDKESGFALCRREGIKAVVLGSFIKAGEIFVTDVKVLDAETKRSLKSASARGEGAASILTLQIDALVKKIAEGMGVSSQKVEAVQAKIGDMTTSSLEAYNYYLKGLEEQDKNRYAEAIPFFKKAVELDPNFAMALAKLDKESIKKAMALSPKVSEKERLFIEARYAERVEGDQSKAISIYRQIVSKYPKEKRAYFALGNMLFAHTQEAMEMYNKVLELDPTYVIALNQIGYLFFWCQEYEKAIEAFQKGLLVQPKDANLIDSLAQTYFVMGRLDESIGYYRKALEVDPEFRASMVGIGYIYALKSDYFQALEWSDKFVKYATSSCQPCRPDALMWKSFYLYWLGNYEKSLSQVQMAENALEELGSKRKYDADFLRAWISYDRGDFELSRAYIESWFAAWIKNNPENLGLEYLNRILYQFLNGLVDLEEQKIDSARSRLKEMDSLNATPPKGADVSIAKSKTDWLRGMISLSEKSYDEAASSFGKTMAFYSPPLLLLSAVDATLYNAPFQKDSLARAYAEKGDLSKAITEYEKLITPDPKKPSGTLVHPLYHHRLGKLYEQKGLKDKAKAEYERFLDLWKDADPGTPEVEDSEKRWANLS